ncbi:hypothetical protein XENOCAPTIV_003907, partial [Xenoophorus captivus]
TFLCSRASSFQTCYSPCPKRTSAFMISPSGGAKPEGHEDDHEMVNMEYACDHCQGLIVGSRINCNVCEDFDLCFGCYNAKKYPDR